MAASSRRPRRPRGELIAWGVLVALALALRFYDLGARPFHHDESQDAYFSWVFQTDGDYKYDPLLHGPLRFYLTAAMYTLFGASDFTARLAPALMGTSMVALMYPLRSAARPDRRLRRRRAAGDRPVVPVLLALRPRGHLHRRDHAGDARRHLPLLRRPAALAPGRVRRAAGRELRDQGDDVHHDLRGGLVLPRRDRRAVAAGRLRARGADRAHPARDRLGAARLGRGRVPRRLHAHLHDVPHAPERHLRALDRAGLLARPARRRPRRRVAGLLLRPAVRARVARAGARHRRRGAGVPPPHPAAAVPGVGVRAVADRLLVGGREVRLAGAAPAAAADPARGRRAAGDLGLASFAARQARPRRDGARARLHRLRLRAGQRGPPRRPARVPRLDPVLDRRRRPRPRDRRARQAPRRQAEGPDRLGRGRHVPVGLVLPRPRRRLPGPLHRRRGAARDRRDRAHAELQHAPAADADRLRRRRDPLPRLVGARLRQGALAGELVALVQRARAVEPDRRDAGVGLPAPRGLRRD